MMLIVPFFILLPYIWKSCKNFDGGFGAVPGAESHAGQIFCCVGALSIAGALDHVDVDLLGWWLCERQCDSGGLNGRPEKQADVCYSWWILSALSIIGRVRWFVKISSLRPLISFLSDWMDKLSTARAIYSRVPRYWRWRNFRPTWKHVGCIPHLFWCFGITFTELLRWQTSIWWVLQYWSYLCIAKDDRRKIRSDSTTIRACTMLVSQNRKGIAVILFCWDHLILV